MTERYFDITELANEVLTSSDAALVNEHQLVANAFAKHLAQHRAAKTESYEPCVISSTVPETHKGWVRLPHLVAIQRNDTVRDTVMWETLPKYRAEKWLARPLPDQQLIEARLGSLLVMRGQHRSGELENTQPAISAELAKGRYLSILFVYQHLPLFEQAWATDET